MLRLRVVCVDGRSDFILLDENDVEVGKLYAGDNAIETMVRFQGARLFLDGKSLKRLQRCVAGGKSNG